MATPTQDPKVDPTPAVNPGAKTVEVPEDVLKDILGQITSYREEIAGLKNNIKEIESTSSQDQIVKIEKLRASGKLVKSVRLNYYNNKLIVGWESTGDDVYIDNQGKEISLQKTKLTFDDGTSVEVPQVELARRKMQREYEVIEEGRTRSGEMLYTVMTDGGKEVKIAAPFIN